MTLEASADMSAAFLESNGVKVVACTFVDNAGITRVKSVPVSKLAGAVKNGIGISYTFACFGVDDHITASPGFDSPSGDMRLIPDLGALTILEPSNGWAWAPVWQYDQSLRIMPVCQRHFAERMEGAAAQLGISFQMTYELEFTLSGPEGEPINSELPSYSIQKQIPVEELLFDLVSALEDQGVSVAQIHPEYSSGQYEISISPRSPLAAADQQVLVRQTIWRIALRHGYRVSFSPVVIPGEVGNGCHLHFSAWQDGKNLFTGGQGPEELTPTGEKLAAGLLNRLSELSAIWAPSVISLDRLKPSTWSGAYACWGWENREAALRLCKGTMPIRHRAANFELKCIDGTINPYLVVGAVIGCCLDGLELGLSLPEPVQVDPATLSEEQRKKHGARLVAENPQSSIRDMENSAFLKELLGEPLYQAYLAVRKFDFERHGQKSLETRVEELRWRYC